MDEIPLEGDKRIFELWKRAAMTRGNNTDLLTPPGWLHDLLIRLSDKWANFSGFTHAPVVPRTNNATEQVISRMKMRTRTVRGHKTQPGMQTGFMLAGTRAN
jgi:hypothetical protein